MSDTTFHTEAGIDVPSVTGDEMREIDRIAVDELDLTLLQMMENAGRNLARAVHNYADGTVVVLAGNGGNGGGGLACARHLGHSVDVRVVLNGSSDGLDGAAAHQQSLVAAMDIPVGTGPTALDGTDPAVVVDTLVGYGLSGPLRGTAETLVNVIPDGATTISLDVPSGVNATTGATPGVAVAPDVTVTLALPKRGLDPEAYGVLLGDIGIPAVVYHRATIEYQSPFSDSYLVTLES